MSKIDGRACAESVLSRLAGEIAYTSKRLVIRRSDAFIRDQLAACAVCIEAALTHVEELAKKEEQ